MSQILIGGLREELINDVIKSTTLPFRETEWNVIRQGAKTFERASLYDFWILVELLQLLYTWFKSQSIISLWKKYWESNNFT